VAESSFVGDIRAPRLVATATEAAGDADLARARGGDDAAFTRLVAPMRRELHAPGSDHFPHFELPASLP
jgi:RNA polymerase sigma-70 factor (ECF subfamily)